MATFVSVQGGNGTGGNVAVNLNAKELEAARSALQSLVNLPTQDVDIRQSVGSPSSPTDVDIYNIAVPPVATFTLDANTEAAALTGNGGGTLIGNGGPGPVVLIGNKGADTINAAGGNGTIIAGDGANTIQLNNSTLAGGNVDIVTGAGHDTVNLWGGNVTVSSAGKKTTVDIHGGNNTVSEASSLPGPSGTIPGGALGVTVENGTNQISLTGNDSVTLSGGSSTVNLTGAKESVVNTVASSVININGTGANDKISGTGSDVNLAGGNKVTLLGNDTIFLGSGSDTITEAGKATVNAVSGSNVRFKDGLGGAAVFNGPSSGTATMLGGMGDDTFNGGTGAANIVGGNGDNVYNFGHGNDTVDGHHGNSNLFVFDTANGLGTGVVQSIKHFDSGSDHIKLVGAETVSNTTVSGGNTEITLSDGTKIELLGFTHLQPFDISH